MTAKYKDIWTPWGDVDAEDVRHMQSRVLMFQCSAKVPKLKDTEPCAGCMARWIREGAAAFDARPALQPVLLLAGPSQRGSDAVQQDCYEGLLGMSEIVGRARLPLAKAATLESEILALGAVHVQELAVEDWAALTAWANLLPFEQRRLLSSLPQQ